MNFRLGLAIWGYKGWLGDLFPSGSRASEFLHLYGQRFTVVEGNTTFYSIPDRTTVARWAAETPAGFEFCLKLPKSLTHHGALTPAIPGVMQFLDQMQGLGDRLGPLFAQLPPGYGPDRFADLEAFLTALPRDSQEFALEVRHLDWFREPHCSRLTAVLKQLGIGRVLLDTRPIYDLPATVNEDPQVHSERRKPRVPLQPEVTAEFSLVRYISHPDLALNEGFLQQWAAQIDEWLNQGKRVYFFVHCPLEERSPSNAQYFQQMLERRGSPIPPLPWNQLTQASTQLSLF